MDDKEWKIFKINKSIDNLYEKSGFFNKYGIQFLIMIAIIIIFVFTFTYISILNNLVPIKKNWATEKCNPLYMPFAGIINNDGGSKSNLDYTIDNFNTCLGIISEDAAQISLDPLNYLIDIVTNSFSSISGLMKNLAGYFASVIATISIFVKEAYENLLNATISFVRVAEVIKDTFGKLTGILTAAMYSQILMMKISFLWVVFTPQKAAMWQYIASVATLYITIGLLVILYLLGIFDPAAWPQIALAIVTIAVQVIIIILCITWLFIITTFTNVPS